MLQDLCAVLGAQGVSTDVDDLVHYGSDRCRGPWPVQPSIVVRPQTIAEVSDAVRICAHHGVAMVPSGGRTGLAGAATAIAGEVVVSMERMNRILEVDPVSKTLRCQAGATVEAVQQAADDVGLLYPVDFAAKGSAHIAGSIATNAGGIRVLRYGTTRAWVSGLLVVLADGRVLDVGGKLVKDNTGYDLAQLFVGSEGTLGLIVEATLRLCVPPAGTLVAACALTDANAVLDLFVQVSTSGLALSAFECFDHGCLEHVRAHRSASTAFVAAAPMYVLLEVEVPRAGAGEYERVEQSLMECLVAAQDDGKIIDAALASTPQQARDLWTFREDISESLHRFTPHKSDISLPVSEVPRFLDAWRQQVGRVLAGYPALVFGHVGDGNLHLNVLRPNHVELQEFLVRCHEFDAQVYDLVSRHGGSISAEHGIGLLKRDFLHFTRSPVAIETMVAIKRALDPQGLLNPGKIFVAESPGGGID